MKFFRDFFSGNKLEGIDSSGEIKNKGSWGLAILALGVVFGDIGTSPLYALRETFLGNDPIVASLPNVLGAVSLFFWTLFIVVTFKYVILIMRADNNGEGGILSLLGLIKNNRYKIPKKVYSFISLLILFGAALLYGDGIITPAISVISAVEGLAIALPHTVHLIVPITLIILFVLFAIQKKGTAKVALFFSPIMVLWLVALIGFALPYIVKTPEIFRSINPLLGFHFLYNEGINAIWIIGTVVLCVTGAEALYADLGHFGRKAITKAWFFFVYPALIINYLGQGARLLDPTLIIGGNLFYSMISEWALFPMIILSTLATVIASQALISGAFSLTYQAMALGVFPRLKVLHTNKDMGGQIYMPFINWMLFLGCALLVLFFRNSGNLAAAYGIAVTGTMVITTMAFFVVAKYKFRWPNYVLTPIFVILITIDLIFFGANCIKFFHGGYVPIVIGIIIFSIMWIWQWGRNTIGLAHKTYGDKKSLSWYIDLKRKLERHNNILQDNRPRNLVESDRMVVLLTSHPVNELKDGIPATLRVYLKRSGVIPKYLIILKIHQERIPFVVEDRYKVINFGNGITSVQIRFGFMEDPDIKKALRDLWARGIIRKRIRRCSIEIGEEEIIVRDDASFISKFLTRTYRYFLHISTPAHKYFGLSEASGLDKIIVPLVVDKEGVRVDIPEFAFVFEEEKGGIDPDAFSPTKNEFNKIS
jgi:KUP system potassium uptake protein